MLAVIGTVPEKDFPLVHGRVILSNNRLMIADQKISVNRGTPALLAAAVKTSETVKGPEVYAFLIGDIGTGTGSRHLYQFLTEKLQNFSFQTLTFHYLQPIAHWHDKVLSTIEKMKSKPFLIADAGYMYAAKMSGHAARYDLFTPDIGELSFLADEKAPHPFYTRGFILHNNDDAPNLIKRAYQHQNAAQYLLVKGERDYIVNKDETIGTVDQPSFEAMEAIGGTGDSLTGLAAVLCSAHYSLEQGAVLAARINRWTGYYANPSPSTQVSDLIEKIPQAMEHVLNEYKMEHSNDGNKYEKATN
jgi:hypothetical protein